MPDANQPGVLASAVQTFAQAVNDHARPVANRRAVVRPPPDRAGVRRPRARRRGRGAAACTAQPPPPDGPVTDSLLIEPTAADPPDKTESEGRIAQGAGGESARRAQRRQPPDRPATGRRRAGTPVTFRNFKLDVQVVLRRIRGRIPSQPPDALVLRPHRHVLTNSATATLTITPDDTAGYRPEDHAPVIDVSLSRSRVSRPERGGHDGQSELIDDHGGQDKHVAQDKPAREPIPDTTPPGRPSRCCTSCSTPSAPS